MDSYARQILLGYLAADLGPWPEDLPPRHRSLWKLYARAVKDATGRWPALARWEPTTERIPSRNPLMHGMQWEIPGGEPAPEYPRTVRETMIHYLLNESRLRYATRPWGHYREHLS